ncbi:hypothetical protein BDZ89DRAFT_176890 [Hymenopellis radicata]|nr:hypothetical protein BDZ89DRAFT_629509 [Hymenopellis radicata]KAF9023147.1 hypothetical protein BDZ89DRAFT_176890 [Hymenopellis radicata]
MPAPLSSSVDHFLDLAAVTADSDEEEEISDDEAQIEDFFDDVDQDEDGAAQPTAMQQTQNIEAPQVHGAKAHLLADLADIAFRYEERAADPSSSSSSSAVPSSSSPSASLTSAETLASPDSSEQDMVDEDIDIGATHHWTAGDGAHERAIRALAQDLNREVVSYAFKQYGTAHEVRRRLSRIHQDHSRLPFDVIDAWLLPSVQNNKKQWRIYLLLDFDPHRILKSLPSDERKVSRTDRTTLVDVEKFLASEFLTISLASRRRILDISERSACLRARKTHHINLVDSWVTVRGGAYAGDVGFAVQGDLYYDVLLVPRVIVDARTLEYGYELNANGKRVSLAPPEDRSRGLAHQKDLEKDLKKWGRRGLRPRARLLDSSQLILRKKTPAKDLKFYNNAIEGLSDTSPEVSSSEWSVFDQLPRRCFDEDLLVLRCRRDCLKPAVCIPPI